MIVKDLWKDAINVGILTALMKCTHIGDDLSVQPVSGFPAMIAYGLAALGCKLNGIK